MRLARRGVCRSLAATAVALLLAAAWPVFAATPHDQIKPPPKAKAAESHAGAQAEPAHVSQPDHHGAQPGPPSPLPPEAQKAVVVVPPGGHGEAAEGPSPEEALKRLMEGNRRFAADTPVGPDRSAQHRLEIASGQKPFAIVVTCSDSRVPPELLFDQGFGDVFVVRTAGNVVDDVAMGSIEYALEHLGAKLIIVLGHTRCGAVTAAVEGGEFPGHLPAIAALIVPAVEKARAKRGDLLPNAVRANVKMVAQKIVNAAPGLAEKVEDGEIGVVGGVYDLETGRVELTYKPLM